MSSEILLGQHPPKPRLVVRVGVTGHRTLGDAENFNRVKAEINTVLSTVEDATAHVAEASGDWISEKAPSIRLVSPLASGADSLVANEACARSWDLQAVLPFDSQTYKEDFDADVIADLNRALESASRVLELDGDKTTPEDQATSYLTAGQYVLEQSDLLIAIWDGKAARGIGGTAMVIELALRRGIPVVWIHAESPQPIGFVSSDFKRDRDLADLPEILGAKMMPPVRLEGKDDARGGELPSFYSERQRRGNYGLFARIFERLISGQKIRNWNVQTDPIEPWTRQEFAPYLKKLDELGGETMCAPVKETLAPRYGWADPLASFYGGLYRSSYVANYLLSCVAVMLALAELIVGFGKETFIAIETLVILAIAGLTVQGRRGQWHEKWIDYRQLAEQLRHSRFLFLTGTAIEPIASRHHYSNESSVGSWVEWYSNATTRELGLPSVKIDGSYVQSVRDYFVDTELRSQLDYHRSNARRMKHLEHSLHRAGDALFGLTLVTCLVFLATHLLYEAGGLAWAKTVKYAIKDWVTFLTAALPAAGAAMLGIRVQGEFGSTAERSEATASRLEEIATQLEMMSKDSMSFSRLRSFVEASAATMLLEIVDWRFIFRGKPLSLPA